MNKVEENKEEVKLIVQNKKARFDYHIIETLEVGIVLTGAEIKAIREDGFSLQESYVIPFKGELYLINAHIKAYSHSDSKDYDPTRRRKLLLHKNEIEKYMGRVAQKGLAIVPLKAYFKKGLCKIEIALAKGKDAPDKRKTIKEKEGKRHLERYMKNR